MRPAIACPDHRQRRVSRSARTIRGRAPEPAPAVVLRPGAVTCLRSLAPGWRAADERRWVDGHATDRSKRRTPGWFLVPGDAKGSRRTRQRGEGLGRRSQGRHGKPYPPRTFLGALPHAAASGRRYATLEGGAPYGSDTLARRVPRNPPAAGNDGHLVSMGQPEEGRAWTDTDPRDQPLSRGLPPGRGRRPTLPVSGELSCAY